ncbi:hypothetical protein LX87_05472 [Larkinella arboricola]|uniref:Uncharacterized protein n=1 Tax=Larkinella arboricola TaxID=643671 RepID=A0A327WJE9_LARAB|nr:hypothetical protein LX87_05472 [Larkinella arboricola]
MVEGGILFKSFNEATISLIASTFRVVEMTANVLVSLSFYNGVVKSHLQGGEKSNSIHC